MDLLTHQKKSLMPGNDNPSPDDEMENIVSRYERPSTAPTSDEIEGNSPEEMRRDGDNHINRINGEADEIQDRIIAEADSGRIYPEMAESFSDRVEEAAEHHVLATKQSTNNKLDHTFGDGPETEKDRYSDADIIASDSDNDITENILPILLLPTNSAIVLGITTRIAVYLANKQNRIGLAYLFDTYKKAIYSSIVILVFGSLCVSYYLHTEFTNCDAPRA